MPDNRGRPAANAADTPQPRSCAGGAVSEAEVEAAAKAMWGENGDSTALTGKSFSPIILSSEVSSSLSV